MSLEYIEEIPDPMPEGKILVHNHVTPSPYIGNRGFRVWLATKEDKHIECPCWYAPQLGTHYRVAAHPFVRNKAESLLGRIYGAIGYAEGLTAEEGDGEEGAICAEIEEAVSEAFEDEPENMVARIHEFMEYVPAICAYALVSAEAAGEILKHMSPEQRAETLATFGATDAQGILDYIARGGRT